MHKPKSYSERLEFSDGKMWRILTAEWKGNEIDCYKENDCGEHFCQNLYITSWGGYNVAFPGEPLHSHYCSEIAELMGYGECKAISLYSRPVSDSEKKMLGEHFKGFEYVLKKWNNPTLEQIFNVLPFWKEHNEVELLIACGYKRMAVNKSFYKLTPSKRKQIIQYIAHNKGKEKSLKEIQEIIKYKITDEQFIEWKEIQKDCFSNLISYPLARYLKKQITKLDVTGWSALKLYQDYTSLCKKTGHSFKDEYWKYPGDLQQAHNKVLAEWDRLCEFERLKRKKEEEQRKIEKFKKLEKLVSHIGQFNAEVDGFMIFFSSDLNEWERQAKTLHQCIVGCDYMGKVASNQCRIAFIQKDGQPVATVQILEGNKIGQFYGDEYDRNNCKPSEEVTAAVEKWVAGLPILLKAKKAA